MRGTLSGMAATKSRLTVTVDADIADQVKAVVAQGGASSVSAYVEHAVKCQLAADADFDVLLATMLDETGGPLTPDERATASRLLPAEAAALSADLAASAARNPDLSEDEALDIAVEEVREVRRARRAR